MSKPTKNVIKTAPRPRVVFRVDASREIGTGHVIRCLTLAEKFRDTYGAQCFFICRQHEGNLIELIMSRGFEVCQLEIPPDESNELPSCDQKESSHVDWLGVKWELDAKESVEYVTKQKPDWLVIDHYALDAKWEKALACCGARLLVIDDLADRKHQADVLLDQNILVPSGHQYADLVNDNCQLLLGPKYALLKSEYYPLAKALPERDGKISRVLVFVGGSDPHNLTEKYLEALLHGDFCHLLVDVVVGKNHIPTTRFNDLIASARIRVYSGLSSLSALMVRSDLMLGAGGTTNWERMCLGLTSIVVSVARNQDKINKELASTGVVDFLGKAENVGVEEIRRAIRKSLFDCIGNAVSSGKARKMVEGDGAALVSHLLFAPEVNVNGSA